jgi:SOUL heme-binding protein
MKPHRMKPFAAALTGLASLLGSPDAMATEEPQYEVVVAEGAMELRRYAPMLIAETEVDGSLDEASNQGFRLIADYIFGNNQSPDAERKAKIAMTAPVTVEPQSSKIAMTAPVTAEPRTAGADMQAARRWRIHFVMPSQYTLETIPKPRNPLVQLREVPGKHYAVHRYSGFNTLSRVQLKTDELLKWAGARSLTVTGTAQLARYDPPWTLPMFRRNEILVEVAAP